MAKLRHSGKSGFHRRMVTNSIRLIVATYLDSWYRADSLVNNAMHSRFPSSDGRVGKTHTGNSIISEFVRELWLSLSRMLATKRSSGNHAWSQSHSKSIFPKSCRHSHALCNGLKPIAVRPKSQMQWHSRSVTQWNSNESRFYGTRYTRSDWHDIGIKPVYSLRLCAWIDVRFIGYEQRGSGPMYFCFDAKQKLLIGGWLLFAIR